MKTNDLALFILRVGIGLTMLLAHGIPKLLKFPELSAVFPDPLGIGSAASLSLAIVTEVVAALALILGFYGRWAALVMAAGMGVAFFIHHSGQPFVDRELAFLFLLPLLTLVIAGPGRWSVTRPQKSSQ